MSGKKEALKIAEFIGCSGAHVSSSGSWMPCSTMEELKRASAEAEPEKKAVMSEYEVFQRMNGKKKSKRTIRGSGFEKLKETGIRGITTLPSGGLVSAIRGDSGAIG